MFTAFKADVSYSGNEKGETWIFRLPYAVLP